MATATTVTISKTEQAGKLRKEIQALEVALSKSTANLARAQEELSHLVDERKALEQAAARGLQQKPGVVAKLLMEIGEAEIPVAGLAPVVAEQQAQLGEAQERLAVLDREIVAEEQLAAREARFEELAKKAHAAVDIVAGDIRRLLEVSFPALDLVRDQLVSEFIGGRYSTGSGPEAQGARALLHALQAKLVAVDDMSVAERTLVREKGFTIRGDTVFTVRNLKPPKA